jgi:hypothetical protein
VTKHIDDKNTRNLGRTREYYDHSMSSHPIRQDLNVLTSTRYDSSDGAELKPRSSHNGQSRRASLTDGRNEKVYGQTVDLVLEHVLLEYTQPSQVLTVFNNAAKAAGIKLTTQTF